MLTWYVNFLQITMYGKADGKVLVKMNLNAMPNLSVATGLFYTKLILLQCNLG